MSHLTEEALAAQDQALLAALPKPKAVPTVVSDAEAKHSVPSAPKLTKEEQYQRDLWHRMLEMIRKGRLDALKSFWDKQGRELSGEVDGLLPEWLEGKDSGAGGTLLQVASASGQEEVIRWLLEDLHANPTTTVPPSFSRFRVVDDGEVPTEAMPPGHRQTAYDICPTSQTRNVFRRCAYAHPDWWDWMGAAGVKSVLTPEMEAKERKKEESRRKMREKAKEREASMAPMTEVDVPAVLSLTDKVPTGARTGPQKVGGAVGAEQGVAGLTPEMRARVERERRARAAEARMKTGQGG